MKRNMGEIDRFIRTVVAAIILFFYFAGVIQGSLLIAPLILGGVLLITAMFGVGPVYHLLGVNTRSNKGRGKTQHPH